MEIKLRMLEEGHKMSIHAETLMSTLKKYHTGKLLIEMAYTNLGVKKLPPSTVDVLPK